MNVARRHRGRAGPGQRAAPATTARHGGGPGSATPDRTSTAFSALHAARCSCRMHVTQLRCPSPSPAARRPHRERPAGAGSPGGWESCACLAPVAPDSAGPAERQCSTVHWRCGCTWLFTRESPEMNLGRAQRPLLSVRETENGPAEGCRAVSLHSRTGDGASLRDAPYSRKRSTLALSTLASPTGTIVPSTTTRRPLARAASLPSL